MDTHELARLTPKGRGEMVRTAVEGDSGKAQAGAAPLPPFHLLTSARRFLRPATFADGDVNRGPRDRGAAAGFGGRRLLHHALRVGQAAERRSLMDDVE